MNWEAELRDLYRDIPDGLLIADATSRRFVYANDSACRMLGYSEPELLHVRLDDLHPPSELPKIAELFEHSAASRSGHRVELACLRKDGSTFFAELVGRVRELGGHLCLIGFFRDVTDRTRAQQALAESEYRYRLVVENVTDIIWTASFRMPHDLPSHLTVAAALEYIPQILASWRFTYLSPSIERVLGYHVEDGLRMSVEQMVAPSSQPVVFEALAEELVLEQDPANDPNRRRLVEVQMITKYRGLRWCEVGTIFLRNEAGRIDGILGVTRDISERKAAELALRESEATLRQLLANMPDLVLLVDEDCMIHFANRDAPGASAEELLGRSGLSFLVAESHETAHQAVRRAFQTREVVRVEVQDIFGHWFSCRLVPMVEAERVASVMVICTDITPQRLAAEAIHREQELLRQMLELSERDRELIAFEIHDGFAQQLTGALLRLESSAQLAMEQPDESRRAFADGLRLLRESIEESRRLVSGLRPPVLDEFGVLPAIEHLILDNRSEGGPNIELVAPDNLPRFARPIENALFRVAQESLTNARRHSGTDRVRLEISLDATHVRLSVRDWGIGFDPDQVAPRHFGLRGICERARLLGGWATIDSAPGRGTCIRVELPRVAPVPMPSQHPSSENE